MQTLSQAQERPSLRRQTVATRPGRARKWRQYLWWLRAVSGVNSVSARSSRTVWLNPTGALPLRDSEAPPPPVRHVVPGVVHAHTDYSDGQGTASQVALAAGEAGARFLILTDHETLAPIRDGWEGYNHGVLTLVGAELRTDKGYLFAIGVPGDFFAGSQRATDVLDAVQSAGGLAFAVHPAHPYLYWQEWSHPALAGLEVLNLHSLSRHVATLPNLARFAAYMAARQPDAAMQLLAVRPNQELKMWDDLLGSRRVVGLGSADAHGQIKIGRRRYNLPSYRQSFQAVQTHLVLRQPLMGDAENDRDAVLGALREGHCRMVYRVNGDAQGFQVYISGADTLTEGETGAWGPDSRLVVRCRYRTAIHRAFRDGQLIGSAEGRLAVFPCEAPGAYRVETELYSVRSGTLRMGVRPWIYTNPIYLSAAS